MTRRILSSVLFYSRGRLVSVQRAPALGPLRVRMSVIRNRIAFDGLAKLPSVEPLLSIFYPHGMLGHPSWKRLLARLNAPIMLV